MKIFSKSNFVLKKLCCPMENIAVAIVDYSMTVSNSSFVNNVQNQIL